MNELWSYILTAVGLTGFWLAGRKVWWCWYVNIANQILWATYALVTDQLGFLIGTVAYSFVFVKNAYAWTKEHYAVEKTLSEAERQLKDGTASSQVITHFLKIGKRREDLDGT